MLITVAVGQSPQLQRRQVNIQKTAPGLVYVSQRIDIVRQLGPEENVFRLDGEPLPMMMTRNVTLGVVIDDKGYVVARLSGVTPENPPQEVAVTSQQGRMFPATFVGMDTVTGLCVLKIEQLVFQAPVFAASASLSAQQAVTLYGFNPQQLQRPIPGLTMMRPRINTFACSLTKAVSDFRYSPRTPIYYLSKPELTAVQDGSVVVEGDNTIFGIAIYDISGEGTHLVYPITRVLNIAQTIIKANKSIANGWLGASGRDLSAPIPVPRLSESRTAGAMASSFEKGVLVTNIFPDSPAEQAGIQKQDILLNVSGRRVVSYAQLGSTLKQLPADSEITLRIKRGEEYKLLPARLTLAPDDVVVYIDKEKDALIRKLKALQPDDPARKVLQGKVESLSQIHTAIFNVAPPEGRLRGLYGLEVESLTPQLKEYFATTGSLLVSSVRARAASAGLLAGDVILKVGGAEVQDLASLVKALDENAREGAIELMVVRQHEQVTVTFAR